MARLRIDQEALSLTKVLENLSGARVKDCFQVEDTIYFIVAPGDIAKALGKNGHVVRLLKQQLNKNIRVIEFHDEDIHFLTNIIYPLNVEKIEKEGNIIFLRDENKKTKSLLIGRGGRNLQVLDRALQRFFPEIEVKIEGKKTKE